ncbi:dynein heavy chain, partial [Kipferlia bialata]|eukprot:g8725.t1
MCLTLRSFTALGNEMRTFETGLVQGWLASCDAIALRELRKPLLSERRKRSARVRIDLARHQMDGQPPEDGTTEKERERDRGRERERGAHRVKDALPADFEAPDVTSLILGSDLEVAVNLSADHMDRVNGLISEASMLSRLEFTITDTLSNVALQKIKFRHYADEINRLVGAMKAAVAGLAPAEKALVMPAVRQCAIMLRPGFGPLNWNSLSVPSYISDCGAAVGRLQQVTSQIVASARLLQKAARAIEAVKIVPSSTADLTGVSGGVPTIDELMTVLGVQRAAAVETALKQYASMVTSLKKIEETITGDASGKCALMSEYYAYWDRRVFKALTTMVLGGFSRLKKLLLGPTDRSEPLFRVSASLSVPDILQTPSLHHVQKVLAELQDDLVRCTIPFLRWEDGTCLQMEPQPISLSHSLANGDRRGDGNPEGSVVVKSSQVYLIGDSAGSIGVTDPDLAVFTYYSDMLGDSQVEGAKNGVTRIVSVGTTNIQRFFREWHQHERIWKVDRQGTLARFVAKSPSLSLYHETMAHYKHLYTKFSEAADGTTPDGTIPVVKEVDFVRINCKPLVSGIANQCELWVHSLGYVLTSSHRKTVLQLANTVDRYAMRLVQEPRDLAALKDILAAQADLRENGDFEQ